MAATRPPASVVWTAAVVDIALVLVFVLIGRGAHDEAFTFAGMFETWWSFAAGLAIGWLVTVAWRRPLGILVPGVVIWVATVAIGMLLRVASGQGVQFAFVIVATVTLGIFLVGWRAIALLIVRLRSRRVAG
jgi:hypothetical protein